MRTHSLLAILIVASLSACSTDRRSNITPTTPTPTAETSRPVSPAPTSPSRVQGFVLDFQTAAPVAGAVVGFATGLDSGGVPIGMTETSVSDANGRYSLTEPPPRAGQGYTFVVNGKSAGTGYPRASNYRADVAVDRGLCVSRYGMVLDSKTYLPISGATGMGTTGPDGWYQVDWGCGVGQVGFNTVLRRVSHPNYETKDVILGRGVGGTYRLDVLLTPK